MVRAGKGGILHALVVAVVLAGLVAPVLSGLAQTVAAAFGRLAAAGGQAGPLDPWRELFATPGLATSLAQTVWTGFAATALSLVLACGLVAALHGRLPRARWGNLLAPLLAAPHAALAIGLAFLIAPSGWIARVLAALGDLVPGVSGWQTPPGLTTVGDPLGLALVLGLAVKETPFFLLVILAALTHLPVRASLAAGRALGHGPAAVWLFVILPQVYPLIRLPVYVVLSFGLTVVDMAIILGPTVPPTLPVLMTRWFLSPDLSDAAPASAAALALTGVVALAIVIWRAGETLLARAGRLALWRGAGATAARALRAAGVAGAGAAGLLGAGSLLALAVWSVAFRWPFTSVLPEMWSLRAWTGAAWQGAAVSSLVVASVSTLLSLVIAILWLEAEDRARLPRAGWATALVFLPLMVPQVAVMPGLYAVLLRHDLAGGMAAVVWANTLYVFPYVMIALSETWRALDPRIVRQAASLGAGPWRQLVAVKIPILTGPILTAAAVGFAVSVAQYLPTLFAGAGRIMTLTTEAVALSSGSDRRVTAVYAFLQSVMPLAGYALAVAAPAVLNRNRRGLAGAFA